MREQAAIAGFNAPLSLDNKDWLKDALMLHHVIYSRKAQLDAIKTAFKNYGILSFAQGKEDRLCNSAFPPSESLIFSPDTVFRHIEFQGDSIESVQDMFVQLLQEIGKLIDKSIILSIAILTQSFYNSKLKR